MISRPLSSLSAIVAIAILATTAPAPGTSATPDAHNVSAQGGVGSAAVRLRSCRNLPGLPTARCGRIEVPLDREDLSAGTTSVAFAVVPRREQSRPSLGTIVPNPGGPGGSTILGSGPGYVTTLGPLLRRRELLLMDPRGVGRSDRLRCSALEDPALIFGPRNRQLSRFGACGRQLGQRARYNGTGAVADDLDDVRRALGLGKLDLFGDSYGTFLMATYAERHPGGTRSVVLSGAYPVNFDPWGRESARALRRAITLVCARSHRCQGSTVIAGLSGLAKRLRSRPLITDVRYRNRDYVVRIDERQLADAVYTAYSGSASPRGQRAVVQASTAARRGDLKPTRRLVIQNMKGLASVFSPGVGQLYSFPSALATTCHDYPRVFDYADDPAIRRQVFTRALDNLRPQAFAPFSPRAWAGRTSGEVDFCLNWPDDPTAEVPFLPGAPLPDVPVLVLSGDLDANTPSGSGRQAAAQFPHARWVEVRGSGHTPSDTPTGIRLIRNFFRNVN